ncbi:FAD dependent sulfhydryl oxidase [Grosmannia clavigera kw1407]|uniref:Sulfhydryl oxidase n=1 Tax=Grosmannia clavigera (strain kw1407 / UAMH 11150) TaxID=655863 RepID=F0XR00_GROCL|nr:FAD dependent sulfhydryl oxidase [Grosmannia clavigera kw1407]EFW99781.1 FAD dependent sulfhydryl oxidase [Grosmannia clavigera kw1407]
MARRFRAGALAAIIFILITTFYLSVSGSSGASLKDLADPSVPGQAKAPASPVSDRTDGPVQFALPASVLDGAAIAPKLENATIKQELGRASWRLMHTMMARFPEEPTFDESLALKTYVQLFARLYPCGDCAAHFQTLLQKYPPQTSSRTAAAGWACFVHNEVNKRLRKNIFDCATIGDFYDCGCGDDKGGVHGASGKIGSAVDNKGKPHR